MNNTEPVARTSFRKGQRIRLRETSWNHKKGKVGFLLQDQTDRIVLFRFLDDKSDTRRTWLAFRFEPCPPEGFSVRGAIFKDIDQAISHAETLARLYRQPVAVEPY